MFVLSTEFTRRYLLISRLFESRGTTIDIGALIWSHSSLCEPFNEPKSLFNTLLELYVLRRSRILVIDLVNLHIKDRN